ncbi:MAG: response regulator [Desulfobacteraceae bacterium]|nr:MAG: response regulator [Desulfobacteraceae bacterium]
MPATISLKIIVVTMVVLLLTLMGSALGTGMLFSKEYARALESRALAIGQSLESQLNRLLNLNIPLQDLSGFENQCKAVVDRFEGISYAMVVEPEGRILFHSTPAKHGRSLDVPVELKTALGDNRPWVRRVGPFYEAIIPIFNGMVDYQGTLHIGFPVESINAKIRGLLISSSIIGMIIALYSVLVLFLSLQSMVTRPLKSLIALMQAIREKRSEIQSSKIITRKDEIGQLTAVFDGLMQELNTSRSEVEKHAGHLETLVTRRTEQLRHANHELLEEVKERHEAEKRFRELFENAPVMYVITQNQPGGPIVTNCNGLFTATIGYERDQIIGSKLGNFYTHESRKQMLLEGGYERALEGTFISEERQLLTREGRVVDTLLQAVPQSDSSGRIIGTRAMFLDVTDRRKSESEKKELLARLQRAEKLESLGVLAGGVAHDLNNILSGIVSYPELLLMQLPDDSPLRKPMLTIQKAGDKAAEIVQDLLTLARRSVSTRQVININDIILDYLSSPEHAKLLSFHPNLCIDIHLDQQLLNISGSPIHIRKTIMNLVSNAAEAQTDGGQIIITTYNHNFDLPQMGYEQIREGDFVALEISDQGCGIPKEDLERIFEPFYTKKVMGRSGTGLGMAVVWGTVQDHQGYIDVRSQPDEGTTVVIYFPVTRMPRTRNQDAIPVSQYTGDGQTILIVDDIKEQREIAASILQRLNYASASVSSGEEAIAYLQSHAADLILLDMIMGQGMDGLETYRKILEIRPGQKVIIASGYAETERVKQLQKLGAGQYIKKPYTIEAIGMAVKNELDSSSIRTGEVQG